MFVIQRNDGKFVVSRNHMQQSTYTDKLQHARIFSSREIAKKHLCPDNERIVPLYDLLNTNIDDSNK